MENCISVSRIPSRNIYFEGLLNIDFAARFFSSMTYAVVGEKEKMVYERVF
jgi:hypothetical protein